MECCCCTGVLLTLGALCLLRFALGALSFFTKLFRTGNNLNKYRTEGCYAVVTGGSGGIGFAYANELAARKFNLVLIAQNEEKLAKAKEDLEKKGVTVVTKSMSFDKAPQDAAWTELRDLLAPLDVAVLVNNVGLTVDPPGKLAEIPAADVQKILSVNVTNTTLFTHMLLTQMLNRKKPSLVVNMTSFVARVPVPMLSVYSASKRYLEHLTSCLSAEYKGKVDFTCVAPWWVATEMTKIKRTSIRVISPAHLAKAALPNLGKVDLVDPYWLHALLDAVVVWVPSFLLNKGIIGFMSDVRRRYLRRAEQAKKQ